MIMALDVKQTLFCNASCALGFKHLFYYDFNTLGFNNHCFCNDGGAIRFKHRCFYNDVSTLSFRNRCF
jgi:hypothetical protein